MCKSFFTIKNETEKKHSLCCTLVGVEGSFLCGLWLLPSQQKWTREEDKERPK